MPDTQIKDEGPHVILDLLCSGKKAARLKQEPLGAFSELKKPSRIMKSKFT